MGISAGHAYLIVGVCEHKGYKYIILKNTNQRETKINYKLSKKDNIKIVELPEQINKEKNECMMELNHFYKKLAEISYDK